MRVLAYKWHLVGINVHLAVAEGIGILGEPSVIKITLVCRIFILLYQSLFKILYVNTSLGFG